MGRKWYEKAYTGTGKGLENLYGGIFGKQTTTGAEYPAGESFQRIMPLIGQVESEAGGIRERLFPEYARQLAEARSLRSNIPRMREKLLPELYRGLEGARAGLPNEEELFGMTKEEYQAALQRAKMEVPSEERLFGVMERRLRESLLPQLAASGLATSQGADVLAPRVSELATTFGERAFERELARQANIRQALEDITGFGERAFGRGIVRQQAVQDALRSLITGETAAAGEEQAVFGQDVMRQQATTQALEGLKTLEILPTEIREKLIALIMGQPGFIPTVSQKPGLWQTLFGGGTQGSSAGAAGQAYSGLSSYFSGGGAASDRRLKTDIVPLNIEYAGVPWYSFRYKWEEPSVRHIGVMYDEVFNVHPEATVLIHNIGHVYYERLLNAQ